MAKIIDVCIFDAASGFLPIASIALLASQPIAIAGPTEPPVIVIAVAKSLIDSVSTFLSVKLKIKNEKLKI